MGGAHKLVMLGLVLAVGTASTVSTSAADRLGPGEAQILGKQGREIERRAVTRPVGPEIDAARRQLRIEGGGALGPRGLVLERQLDRIPPSPRVAPPAPAQALPERPLPSGTLADPGALPSAAAQGWIAPGGGSDDVTMAARLIDRADRAIDGGDTARAASDLALARRMLDALPTPDAASPAAPRLGTARARLDAVEARL